MADAMALMQWEERGIVKTQQKLADFVQYFQSMMDINNEGMPLYLIDPTVIAECIPYAATTDDIPEDKYNDAIRCIDFEDGVPCVDGLPIWERLDGETLPYYKIFKEYRDMKYVNDTVANSTNRSTESGLTTNNVSSPSTRSMARLAETLATPGRTIATLAKIYHWAPRVKAYDAQKAFELELQKQRNIENLESKHAKYSNEILDQAMTYLTKNVNKLDPKVALQMLELGMKYGRISSGLLGDKPGTQAAGSAGGHQTNIAISQNNTTNQADNMLNINSVSNGQNGQGGSKVERQLNSNMKDASQLTSILHVLNASGAFKAVVGAEVTVETDEDEASRYDMYDDGVALSDIIDIEAEDADADYIDDIEADNMDEDNKDIEDEDDSTGQQTTTALTINNDKAVPGTSRGHAYE